MMDVIYFSIEFDKTGDVHAEQEKLPTNFR